MATRTWGRSPRTSGRSPVTSARRQSSTRASPCRSAWLRTSPGGRSPFISAPRAACTVSAPTGSRCPPRCTRPASETAMVNRRSTSAASASAPSGATPATPRRTPLAGSSGPSCRAAPASTRSVSATEMPRRSALSTRVGVTAAVTTATWAAVSSPAAKAASTSGSSSRRRPARTRPRGVTTGEPAVPRQPGLHGSHAVVAVDLAHIGGPDDAGLPGGELVDRRLQVFDGGQQLGAGEIGGLLVVGVERQDLVDDRTPSRHRRPPPRLPSADLDTSDRYRQKPQLSGRIVNRRRIRVRTVEGTDAAGSVAVLARAQDHDQRHQEKHRQVGPQHQGALTDGSGPERHEQPHERQEHRGRPLRSAPTGVALATPPGPPAGG